MKLLTKDTVSLSDLKHHKEKLVAVNGWVFNKRSGKENVFLLIRDGSGFAQCVINSDKVGNSQFDTAKRLGIESAIHVKATVVEDERQVGGYELQASELKVYHEAEEYPIAKKEHGPDFLLDNRHLWLRSRRQWAIMRVRNTIIFAIHRFFQKNGFVEMDAPIFTGNACEGTSTLFETDFFETPAYLSQSGQLYGEAMAFAMGKIYTFGPTFRAEKSKTRRHLSEFWMIEPEMAFYNLEMTMDLIQEFVHFLVKTVLEECRFELEQLERDTAPLEKVLQDFPRISYDDAVKIIKGEKDVEGRNAIQLLKGDLESVKIKIGELREDIAEREASLKKGGMKKGAIAFNEQKIVTLKLEVKELEERERNIPQWLQSASDFVYGGDFGGSDETVLTRLFDTPVMVYNWPKAVKAFYMKGSDENPALVKGVDVLAPEGYGEIIGGGERETDKDILIEAINHHALPMSAFEWYLDLRRYGSVPHAGFGLGLERMVSWICKLTHLRESIPFPRMMGRLMP
ncbi:MAG: asparagine--tRNA ligase [Bacteroidia bacterium]